MALVYLADYFTAPSAFVTTLLREVERRDSFSVRDLVQDLYEWKTMRDEVARLIDPRPRYLAPAFFPDHGSAPKLAQFCARPSARARSYPPPKHSFYQGDF